MKQLNNKKTPSKQWYARIFAAGLLMAGASTTMAGSLEIEHDWIALQPPGAQASAAFMLLNNPGDADVHIVSADAPGFDTVELHLSINEDGMHRMVEQERITIKAGSELVMAPGGYHIMLIGPEQDLTEHQIVPVSLTLESGEVIEQEIKVIRREHAPEPTSGQPMHNRGHHRH